MSKKKREKSRSSTSQRSGTSFSLLTFWNEKKPILIFLLGFGILMGVFYAFWFSEIFITHILAPVVKVNAAVGSAALNLFGYGTQSSATDIFSKTFSISVKQGCDAIEPIAIFTFAVFLFPVSLRSKAIGLPAGVSFLLLLNLVRIVSLFVAGIYSPTLFEIMHIQVWQALFIVVTLVCLAYWIIWAMGRDKSKIVNHK